MTNYKIGTVEINPTFAKGIRHYLDREFLKIEEIIEVIKKYEHIDMKKERVRIKINGRICKITSQRLRVFIKNTTCVTCGIKGKFFSLERDPGQKNPHLNLYALNKKGEAVLMTKDHTIPKSKGGQNIMSNYKTMCTYCNTEKGNKII